MLLDRNNLILLLFDLGILQPKKQSEEIIPELLAKWSGHNAADLAIGKNDKKKPFFLNPDLKNIDLSISHTNNWLCCAIYKERQIGLDIERIDRKANLNLAARYFAKEEVSYLQSEQATKVCFIRLWTLKEAYGKALGVGINQRVLATSFLSLLLQEQNEGTVDTTDNHNYWLHYEELQTEGLILSYCSSISPKKVVLEKVS